MNMIFKNKDVKVILLEVFLIALGLVGLTLGVKYIMNSINVNVDTSKLAIDSMNANVTNGTLTPIEDSSVNINTTSNVLRITFDVKGASTNTGNNIIYDAILNIDTDCSLKNENIKWNLYKNNNLLTSGTTSPKYDKDVLNGKITLTDTQQDLVPYSKTADKYVFILWMSESCNEDDITKCDISNALTSDSGGKSISGNIDIRLNSGKKKENKRETVNVSSGCNKATTVVERLDDGTTGDEGSGVYKVSHDAITSDNSATGSEIPAVTDYRYYGASPNNYVCLDMEGGSTCSDKHLYRIIGSIYEELEDTNRIKVIKATVLTDGTTNEFSWNFSSNRGRDNIWATITSGNYSNSLTSGSTLMQLLNSGSWWNGTSGTLYYSCNINYEWTSCPRTVNFQNYKLSDRAKSYISMSRYYLGSSSDPLITPSNIYIYERGTRRFDDLRSLYWDGYVGLMYASDFGYASGNNCAFSTELLYYDNNNCCQNGWVFNNLFEWLLTTGGGDGDHSAFSVQYEFNKCNVNVLESTGSVSDEYSVRPTFYLKSDAVITSGTGTLSDPYLLG